jgi:hypothetical protein
MNADHRIRMDRPTARLGAWFVLAALVLMPGCGGCIRDQPLTPEERDKKLAEEKKKKEEAQKDPFQTGRVYSLPADMEKPSPYFKPGHWTEFTTEIWANHADFFGDLVTDPMKLDGMPYRLGSSRPALLPKAQKKFLNSLVFIPPGEGGKQIYVQLTPRGSTRGLKGELIPTQRMKSWVFNFLVLAKEADDYKQLFGSRKLDSLRPSTAGFGDADADSNRYPYYWMRVPKLERYVPVAENSLAWSSTAYVLWDGIDPSLLTPGQQQAMLDWIHWGGQLIVSGPDSLDALKGSFLEPLLPATSEEDIQLAKEDMQSFDKAWTNKDFREPPDSANLENRLPPGFPQRRPRAGGADPNDEPLIKKKDAKDKKEKEDPHKARRLNIVKPWGAKKLIPVNQPGVEVLAVSDRKDKAPLVVDRRVGLGRVAMTAFRLSQKELRLSNWPSFDSFLNGCLLRRMGRKFHRPEGDEFFDIAIDWVQPGSEGARSRFNADRVSQVRYFSRDAVLQSSVSAFDRLDQVTLASGGHLDDRPMGGPDNGMPGFNPFARGLRGQDDSGLLLGANVAKAGPGVAGWNDFNQTAQLARHALKDAAGIVIPRADYVLGILAVYVIVLVPLNWLVFWLMRRVEWAWFAAPLITVLCAVAVVRLAELDIGFARSRTELALVELQGDYARAHVTRFTGLYASLATAYDLRFDDPASVVQPFAAFTRQEIEEKKIYLGDLSTVNYRRDDDRVTLTGFNVTSNSTGMLHCEHMLDTGGGIRLSEGPGGTLTITNGTKLNLRGAALIGHAGVAWIDDEFNSGATKTVRLERRAEGSSDHWFQERESNPVTSRERRDDMLKARLLVRMAESIDTLADGELRLVAWTDDELPGMVISPSASQARFANVVVAHLKYGPMKYGKRNEDDGSREGWEKSDRGFRFNAPGDDEKEMPDIGDPGDM